MTSGPHKHLDHEVPEWVPANADFFLTLCAEPRHRNQFCEPKIGRLILEAIALYHQKQNWYCHLAVLMPDHLHMIVCFPDDQILSKVIGLWKQALSRRYCVSWQRNFFDHRIRGGENIQEKADYILQNPVRAGLVKEPNDWPYVWTATEWPLGIQRR